MTHIMQVRDLTELFTPHDPTCGVVATFDSDENYAEMPVLHVRRDSRSRRLLIVVEGESKVPDLEEEVERLERKSHKSEALLEQFDTIMADVSNKDNAMTQLVALHEKVLEHFE